MSDERKEKSRVTYTQAAMRAGILGNSVVFGFWLLMVLQPGFRSGKAFFIIAVLAAIPTLIVGLPTALLSFRSSDTRLSMVALILSLSPYPLAAFLTEVYSAYINH
jgi:hypothetical protein